MISQEVVNFIFSLFTIEEITHSLLPKRSIWMFLGGGLSLTKPERNQVIMGGQDSKKKALEQLKAQRTAKKKALNDYSVESQDHDIFHEVSEKDYNMLVRRRIQDDFVVDDDGLGYTDYGLEDWDMQNDQNSDLSGDERIDGKSSRKGTAYLNPFE